MERGKPGRTASVIDARWDDPWRKTLLAILLLLASFPMRAQNADASAIRVVDDTGRPLSGVVIEGLSGATVVCAAATDAHGEARLSDCRQAGLLRIQASLHGYLTAVAEIEGGGHSEVDIVLAPAAPVQQTVTVQADPTTVLTESESSETRLPIEQATGSTLRPNTVLDALPLVPGVIRTPDGQVQISGLEEQHSSLLINAVNVNDPATGHFGLGVPVDSVDMLKVMQSPYLAQYGSFSAGVVSAETRRGGDKWVYSLNDPLPDFRIRSAHLEGIRDASPRLNLSGPLLRNRLYFVEGSEYLADNAEVRTLPHPVNETRSEAFNSFTQIDALAGSRNTFTGTVHFAPHSLRYANLNYFDPQPVTPNADYQEDTGTLTHRFALGPGTGLKAGLLSSTFATTRVATHVSGQSNGAMLLTPLGDNGNYFGRQDREATRFQWIETWNPGTVARHGEHAFQAGSIVAHAEDEGTIAANDVRLTDAMGHTLRTIAFSAANKFSLADFEPAVYVQDHWVLDKHVALDAGLRGETQSLAFTTRFAPRGGFTWNPVAGGATVVRGGAGVFYDAVPLDTYAFSRYPRQTITTYDRAGNITDGPRTYINLLGQAAATTFPFLHQQQRPGNFAPYSVAWNVEGERAMSEALTVRLRYLHADEHNQLTLAPVTGATENAIVLADNGTLRSRQFETTARIGARKARQFYFSYVRQFARGDRSDASSYLGDFPYPAVRAPITASTAGEVPNRFLFWGTTVLPWRMHLAPHIEYRNGFTWQPVDALQNYAALSGPQPRYPAYFSADARVAKDLDLGPQHAVRLSLTLRNLTDHANPLQVHGNTADPLYGTFFGNYGRHELFDFDFLF